MTLSLEQVEARFSKVIDLGGCVVGSNLNLLVLRGFARLDALSVISDSDVFDQHLNPKGTQRNISKEHARDCLGYALAQAEGVSADQLRFFPEILLNARDSDVVEFYDVEDPTDLVDFDSMMDEEAVPRKLIGVRVRLDALSWPKSNKSPKISRVDGNHRLFGMDELLIASASGEDEVPEDLPSVSFALMVGVSQTDEARLFRDINGEHKGMEVAHLDSLAIRFTDTSELKADPRRRPLWMAHELSRPGKAFDGMVFMGGSKTGVKDELGMVPPVKINSLKSTIAAQLHHAPNVSAALASDPDVMLAMVNNYWTAVRESFPDAWANRRDFILLQAIGLGAFARFGGQLLERAYQDSAASVKDFMHLLEPVKNSVSLNREQYPGVAGAGGQALIARKLAEACGTDGVQAAKLRDQLLGSGKTVDEKIAEVKKTRAKQA